MNARTHNLERFSTHARMPSIVGSLALVGLVALGAGTALAQDPVRPTDRSVERTPADPPRTTADREDARRDRAAADRSESGDVEREVRRLRDEQARHEVRQARIDRLREIARRRADASERLAALDRLEQRERAAHQQRLDRARDRLGRERFDDAMDRIDRQRMDRDAWRDRRAARAPSERDRADAGPTDRERMRTANAREGANDGNASGDLSDRERMRIAEARRDGDRADAGPTDRERMRTANAREGANDGDASGDLSDRERMRIAEARDRRDALTGDDPDRLRIGDSDRARLREAVSDHEVRQAWIQRLRNVARERKDSAARLAELQRLEEREAALNRERLARIRESLGDDEFSREMRRIDRARLDGVAWRSSVRADTDSPERRRLSGVRIDSNRLRTMRPDRPTRPGAEPGRDAGRRSSGGDHERGAALPTRGRVGGR